jgi:hypothetical protein
MTPGAITLALMEVWAQTVGRYRTGLIPPQSGIYIGHAEVDKILGMLLLALLAAAWLGFFVLLVLYAVLRRRRLFYPLAWQAAAVLVAAGSFFVPSWIWDESLVASIGPGKTGGRLLGDAAREGDTARLRKLLDMGVAVDAPNREGSTESSALVEAVRRRKPDAVALLLERGADPNHRAVIDRPLVSAVMAGDVSIVRMLVEHGANPCTTRLGFDSRGGRTETSVQALARDHVRAVLPPCPKSPENPK